MKLKLCTIEELRINIGFDLPEEQIVNYLKFGILKSYVKISSKQLGTSVRFVPELYAPVYMKNNIDRKLSFEDGKNLATYSDQYLQKTFQNEYVLAIDGIDFCEMNRVTRCFDHCRFWADDEEGLESIFNAEFDLVKFDDKEIKISRGTEFEPLFKSMASSKKRINLRDTPKTLYKSDSATTRIDLIRLIRCESECKSAPVVSFNYEYLDACLTFQDLANDEDLFLQGNTVNLQILFCEKSIERLNSQLKKGGADNEVLSSRRLLAYREWLRKNDLYSFKGLKICEEGIWSKLSALYPDLFQEGGMVPSFFSGIKNWRIKEKSAPLQRRLVYKKWLRMQFSEIGANSKLTITRKELWRELNNLNPALFPDHQNLNTYDNDLKKTIDDFKKWHEVK